jgi:hypothetical protein
MDLFSEETEEHENKDNILLETDWIQEFEKIVDEGIYYPCESMVSLPVYCFFVEKNTIIHISKKIIPFEFMLSSPSQGGSRNILPFLQKISKEPYWMEWMKDHTEFIGSEEALEIEEKRLEKRAKQFSLSDVLFFQVDLGMDDFEALGLDSVGGGFFQSYSAEEWGRLEEFKWKDSVFLFHSINSVYFVFRDIPVVPIEVEDLMSPASSVLVEMPVSSLALRGVGGGGGGKMKRENTRKVRFWDTMDREMDDGDMESSDSDMETDMETEEWGKGKWIQKRRKHRRKTEKRKHVFSPALIRSFFSES